MIYDVLGVGFGPSNIALAVAMREARCDKLSTIFIERNQEASWHDGMLLDGSDVQHNMLRDLVTPVNPLSRFSFVNYLHEAGRFFEFLNLGRAYALRRDFFEYVKWVAGQFDNVRYGAEVVRLELDDDKGETVWCVTTDDGTQYRARSVVLGTGRNLNIPRGLEESDQIIHLSRYLHRVNQLDSSRSVAVLGASQSAVELLLDLRGRGMRDVHAIHRSFSFRLKDTSPFSDEVYFPEFVDYYHALPPEQRSRLDGQVRQTNYSCADRDVIDSLYSRLYEDRVKRDERVHLHRNREIVGLHRGERLELKLRDVYTGETNDLAVDLLILATGYLDVGRSGRMGLPWLLRDLSGLFRWSGDYLDVERDYRVGYRAELGAQPPLYLNGLCESSHGMGDAGSFSLVSLRARDVLTSILKNRPKHESRIHDLRNSETTVRPQRSAGV